MPASVPSNAVQAQAHRLMREVLALKDQRWVDETKVLAIANQINLRDIEAKIYFLRELLGIVRRLPLKIYKDPEDRLRLIGAIQAALDVAVDEEEGGVA